MYKILFVCTANTCRSPLAEYLLKQLVQEAQFQIEVRSAGVYAHNGASISKYSDLILRERGIDHQFVSERVNDQLMGWADLILTMTQSHKFDLIQRYPSVIDKTYTLKEFVLLDADVLSLIDNLNKLYAALEMQISLGQSIQDEQRRQIRELEKQIPNLDVEDPFAGSVDNYRDCSAEIEHHLRLLLQKLQGQLGTSRA